MKLVTMIVLAALAVLLPLAVFADSTADFQNKLGTFTASMGGDLTLSGSVLVGVSGLGVYDCPNPALCNGSVGLTTGKNHIVGGGSLASSANFGGTPPGTLFGNIMVKGNPGGPGGAFVFTGMFSDASWTKHGSGPAEFWIFEGTIMNGMLTENGIVTETNINGATVDLTTNGMPVVNSSGFNTWQDSGGDTTFPSPVPEQGTLSLLGTGLIGIGFLARRRFSARG